MTQIELVTAKFKISNSARAFIAQARQDANETLDDPLDVVGIGWGEIRPVNGKPFEDVVVGFYRKSQVQEIIELIQHVSGIDLVFHVAPKNLGKFDGKTIDYNEKAGFHLI